MLLLMDEERALAPRARAVAFEAEGLSLSCSFFSFKRRSSWFFVCLSVV
jgi:hypothetical protein